jgi:hypothetical protein
MYLDVGESNLQRVCTHGIAAWIGDWRKSFGHFLVMNGAVIRGHALIALLMVSWEK